MDPSRYLPAVSLPIFFVNGTIDFAYPLDSYQKSFDSVSGKKQLRITVNMPHGHPPGWAPAEIGMFVDHHLLGADGLAEVGEPKTENGQVRLQCTARTGIKQASLHSTSDTSPVNQRTWQTTPATIQDRVVSVAAPGPDTSAWFVTVTDDRDAVVSSRVVFVSK